MGKFGETYDRLVNELAIAPVVAPALPAIKAAGSAAVVRGLAALGGGLATLMSNKTKTTTKTKTKKPDTELTTTTSKTLPGVEGPVVQSKFNECYDRIVTEIMIDPGGLAVGPRAGAKAGGLGFGAPRSGGLAGSGQGLRVPSSGGMRGGTPTVTSTSTYTSPGPVRPSGSVTYNTPSTTSAPAAGPSTSGSASGTIAGPAAAAGVLGAAATTIPNDTLVTTPTSPATQPDLEPGTLTTTPATDTSTLNVQAQPQTTTQPIGKFDTAISDLISTGLATATLLQPQTSRSTQRQTRTTRRRPNFDLIPTSSKALPGVEGPIVQDKFLIP